MSDKTDLAGLAAIGVIGYLGIKYVNDTVSGAVNETQKKYSDVIDKVDSTATGLQNSIDSVYNSLSAPIKDLQETSSKFSQILAEGKEAYNTAKNTPVGEVVIGGVQNAADWWSKQLRIPRMIIPGVPTPQKTATETKVSALQTAKNSGETEYNKYVSSLTDDWNKTIQQNKANNSASKVSGQTVTNLATAKASGEAGYNKYVQTLGDTWTNNLNAAKVSNASKKSNTTSSKPSSQAVTPVTAKTAVIKDNKSTSQISKITSGIAKTAGNVASKTVTGQAIKAASSTVSALSKKLKVVKKAV